MANANTITGFQGGTGRNQIIPAVVTTATTSLFQVQTDSGTPATAILAVPYGGSVTGASNPLDPNANSAITGFNLGAFYGRPNGTNAPWYSTTSFDNAHNFKVRITGTVTSAATSDQTAKIEIYLGTTASGSNVGATGAHDVSAGGTFNFTIESQLFWDSGSETVAGWTQTSIGGTSVAQAEVTAVTDIAAISDLTFVASVTTAEAGTITVNVSEFSIDQV